jgi:lipid A 3-O-deacylase
MRFGGFKQMVATKWVIGLALLAGLSVGMAVRADQSSELAVGVGSWETLRAQYRKPEVDIDYRSGTQFWILRPHVGVLAAGDGDYYAYGGLLTDFNLGSRIVLTLNTAIGGYGGNGYHLGSHFEFRNGAEIAYRFENDWRAGVGFYHISNAGITRDNGGSESALFTVVAPLPW